jgi:hypothetical protein
MVENFLAKKGENPHFTRVCTLFVWKRVWKMFKFFPIAPLPRVYFSGFSPASVKKSGGKVENPVENPATFQFSTKILTKPAKTPVFL